MQSSEDILKNLAYTPCLGITRAVSYSNRRVNAKHVPGAVSSLNAWECMLMFAIYFCNIVFFISFFLRVFALHFLNLICFPFGLSISTTEVVCINAYNNKKLPSPCLKLFKVVQYSRIHWCDLKIVAPPVG